MVFLNARDITLTSFIGNGYSTFIAALMVSNKFIFCWLLFCSTSCYLMCYEVSDVKEFWFYLMIRRTKWWHWRRKELQLNISLQPKLRMLKTRWIQLFSFWYAALLNKSLVLSWTLELININCNEVSRLELFWNREDC